MKVQIAFDLSANGLGNYFTLNDATKGVLDNTTYKLGGDVLVDVTSDVRSLSVNRGRSKQLQKFTSGAANMVLSNVARKYDPTFVASVGSRTNLVTNPSFETNTTGWNPIAGSGTPTLSRITTDSLFGSSCGLLTKGSGRNEALISSIGTAGTTYTLSGYVKVPSGQESMTAGARLLFLNASLGSVSSFIAGSTQVITSSSGWVRFSVSGTAPANTAYVRLYLGQVSGGTAGQTFQVDAALVEASDSLNPYFDGSYADGSIRLVTQGWDGAANASTSTITYKVPGTGSPYSGSILPRKRVVIEHLGQTLYTGNVEDWNFTYDLGGNNTAEPSCVDGFAYLAQTTLTPGTATPQATGARVNAVLTDTGWPLTQRAISTGVSTLGADVIAPNTNALNYLQMAEISDAGAAFIGKDGAFVFRSRADLQTFSSNVAFGTGGIGFTDIQVTYGTEELFNTVAVTYTGGTVTVSDATSIAAYGATDLTINTLLANASDAAYVANWFLSKYATPTYRVNLLTVALHGLSTSDAQAVLGLELGDMVLVTWTPGNVGSALSRYATVDGIKHDADPSQHFVTLTLSESFQAFQLDSAVFGELNDDPLGF